MPLDALQSPAVWALGSVGLGVRPWNLQSAPRRPFTGTYTSINCTFQGLTPAPLLLSHCRTTAEKTDLLTGGPIVLVPAVPNDWAGRFRLRARGGFVVNVQFQRNRRPVEVRIESERGQTLVIANPFAECQVTKDGKPLLTSQDATLSIPTRPGDVLEFAGTGTRAPGPAPR